jgi:hypothetical protein
LFKSTNVAVTVLILSPFAMILAGTAFDSTFTGVPGVVVIVTLLPVRPAAVASTRNVPAWVVDRTRTVACPATAGQGFNPSITPGPVRVNVTEFVALGTVTLFESWTDTVIVDKLVPSAGSITGCADDTSLTGAPITESDTTAFVSAGNTPSVTMS